MSLLRLDDKSLTSIYLYYLWLFLLSALMAASCHAVSRPMEGPMRAKHGGFGALHSHFTEVGPSDMLRSRGRFYLR